MIISQYLSNKRIFKVIVEQHENHIEGYSFLKEISNQNELKVKINITLDTFRAKYNKEILTWYYKEMFYDNLETYKVYDEECCKGTLVRYLEIHCKGNE